LSPAAGRARSPCISSDDHAFCEGGVDVVLLGDGDSDRVLTECALYRAQTRLLAMGNDRLVRVAWAPAGQDFNNLLDAP
jgi:hypothetical protein